MARSSPISDPSLKDKNAKGLSGIDLCALCFLFGHPLVFIRRGSRERRILIPQKQKETTNRRDPGGRRKSRKGIMEEWNIGMVGKKNRMLKPIIPSFQDSNLFALRSPRALRLISFSSSSEGAEAFMISYAMKKTAPGEEE